MSRFQAELYIFAANVMAHTMYKLTSKVSHSHSRCNTTGAYLSMYSKILSGWLQNYIKDMHMQLTFKWLKMAGCLSNRKRMHAHTHT